jgi:uncharacterized protein DUF4349
MKKKYSSFLFFFVLSSIIICSGCATVEEPKYVPIKDYKTRLEHAKQERKALNNILAHAQTVDTSVQARERLERVQRQIEELEAGQKVQNDLDAGFESTKKRTIVYGPIGWVLVGSSWILEHLFILYPWNWRAY